MKITGNGVERFLKTPDPKLQAALIYGPDSGLVGERAQALIAALDIDPNDPFALTELTAGDVTGDPARLRDDCGALSLTGGRRLVLLRAAADALTSSLEDLLADPPGAAFLLVLAGELPPRSKLRRLFEGAKNAAALPCYQDDERSLANLLRGALAEGGFEIAPDALSYLAENLGADRQITRRELEKLMLYLGQNGDGPRRVEWQDVAACLADGASQTLDDLALAVGEGDLPGVERGLRRLTAEGVNAVSLLRALARHFHRLATAAEGVAKGGTAEQAVERLRPPVFWKHKGRVAAQVRAWRPRQLTGAERILLETEMLCKTSGLPMQALAEQAAFRLARAAPGRRR